MEIQNKVAFVTGANRGIGRAIVSALINNGASKVYAGARDIESLDVLISEFGDKIVGIELNIIDEDQIVKVAQIAQDVSILVNNAGVCRLGNFIDRGIMDSITKNFEVNVYGLLKVTQAFLPILKNQEEAAIINISSISGLANMSVTHGYSVSKAAVHSITQGLRAELKNTGVFVAGVYPGPIDTDMGKNALVVSKESPINVAIAIIKGLEEEIEDVYPDPISKEIGEIYASSPKSVEKMFLKKA